MSLRGVGAEVLRSGAEINPRLRAGNISEIQIADAATQLTNWASYVLKEASPEIGHKAHQFNAAKFKDSLIDDMYRFQDLKIQGLFYVAFPQDLVNLGALYYKMEKKRLRGTNEASAYGNLFGAQDSHGIPEELRRPNGRYITKHVPTKDTNGFWQPELRLVPFNSQTNTGFHPALLGIKLPMDGDARQARSINDKTQQELRDEILATGLGDVATLAEGELADFLSIVGSQRMAGTPLRDQFMSGCWARLLSIERVEAGGNLWASSVGLENGQAYLNWDFGYAYTGRGFFVSIGLNETN